MSDFVKQKSCIKFCVHKMFREGRERVEDKERPGREKTSTDEQHVAEI